MIDSETLQLLKIYKEFNQSYIIFSDSRSSLFYTFNEENIFLGTSSGSYIYIVQFNNDLSINNTKSYMIINYFNERLDTGHSFYKYFNNTLYLSTHRTYYQAFSSIRYVAFFLKTNSYFDLDFWDTNVIEPLQSLEVRKLYFMCTILKIIVTH